MSDDYTRRTEAACEMEGHAAGRDAVQAGPIPNWIHLIDGQLAELVDAINRTDQRFKAVLSPNQPTVHAGEETMAQDKREDRSDLAAMLAALHSRVADCVAHLDRLNDRCEL